MKHLTTDLFIKLLQSNNPSSNVSISWSSGEEISPPDFYFFSDANSTLSWLYSKYETPFIVDPNNIFTKCNAVVSFDDSKCIINISYYKYDSTHYKFDSSEFYNELKQLIIANSITWEDVPDN